MLEMVVDHEGKDRPLLCDVKEFDSAALERGLNALSVRLWRDDDGLAWMYDVQGERVSVLDDVVQAWLREQLAAYWCLLAVNELGAIQHLPCRLSEWDWQTALGALLYEASKLPDLLDEGAEVPDVRDDERKAADARLAAEVRRQQQWWRAKRQAF